MCRCGNGCGEGSHSEGHCVPRRLRPGPYRDIEAFGRRKGTTGPSHHYPRRSPRAHRPKQTNTRSGRLVMISAIVFRMPFYRSRADQHIKSEGPALHAALDPGTSYLPLAPLALLTSTDQRPATTTLPRHYHDTTLRPVLCSLPRTVALPLYTTSMAPSPSHRPSIPDPSHATAVKPQT